MIQGALIMESANFTANPLALLRQLPITCLAVAIVRLPDGTRMG